MQLLGMLILQNFAGLSILTTGIDSDNFGIDFIGSKEWLFYRPIFKMPQKAGMQITERPIKM